MARMAMGVAALPSPNRLAAMFMVTYFLPLSFSPGYKKRTRGRNSLLKKSANPIFSIMPKNPNQKPYSAANSTANLTDA